MASGFNFPSSNGTAGAGQLALDRFAEMMIERMEQMKSSDWKQGWIGGGSGYAGLPQNVGGRNYSGSNSFFLQLQTAAKGYELPVYLTFKQAHNLKAHVLSGEKSFPVVYWDMMVKDKDGKKISSDEYKAMTKEERKNLDVIPFVKAFPVFNIDQTNLREVQPERVQKLLDKFKVPELRDTQGMYAHAALDRMIQQQAWLCPIQADKRESAAYYPHRLVGGKFGDPKYAKEELVAELTAAMISHSMGFDSKITDNSAAYLDSWIGVLKQEPKFIVSIMADVNKASDLILDHVDNQRLALGEQPYLAKNDPWLPSDPNEEVPFRNAAIFKTRSGDYAIRASYDGVDLGRKPIEKSTARTYFQLTDVKDKESFLNMTARKQYESEIAGIGRSVEKSKSLSI